MTDLIHMLLSFRSKLNYNHSTAFLCKNRLMQFNLLIFHILLMFYSRTVSHISWMCFTEIRVKTYLLKDQYLERHLPIKMSQTLLVSTAGALVVTTVLGVTCHCSPDFLLNSSSSPSFVIFRVGFSA